MVRAWHGRGMASVNQTRPHCVNQMAKTHSKPLAARHAMCESAFSVHTNCKAEHDGSEGNVYVLYWGKTRFERIQKRLNILTRCNAMNDNPSIRSQLYNHKPGISSTHSICVSWASCNKQPLFPCTTFTDWSY